MIRGDSGLTDSKFMQVQKYIQDKHAKYVEGESKDAEIEKIKERLSAGAKPPTKKTGLWSIIKGLFK